MADPTAAASAVRGLSGDATGASSAVPTYERFGPPPSTSQLLLAPTTIGVSDPYVVLPAAVMSAPPRAATHAAAAAAVLAASSSVAAAPAAAGASSAEADDGLTLRFDVMPPPHHHRHANGESAAGGGVSQRHPQHPLVEPAAAWASPPPALPSTGPAPFGDSPDITDGGAVAAAAAAAAAAAGRPSQTTGPAVSRMTALAAVKALQIAVPTNAGPPPPPSPALPGVFSRGHSLGATTTTASSAGDAAAAAAAAAPVAAAPVAVGASPAASVGLGVLTLARGTSAPSIGAAAAVSPMLMGSAASPPGSPVPVGTPAISGLSLSQLAGGGGGMLPPLPPAFCFHCSKLGRAGGASSATAAAAASAAATGADAAGATASGGGGGGGGTIENGLKWLECVLGSALVTLVLSYLGPKHGLLRDHTLAAQITHTIHGCEHAGGLGAYLDGVFSLLLEQVTLTQSPNASAASMTALRDLCQRFIEQSKGVAKEHERRLANEQRARAGLADAKHSHAYVSLQRTINLWVPIVKVSGRYKIQFHEQMAKARPKPQPPQSGALTTRPASRSRSGSKSQLSSSYSVGSGSHGHALLPVTNANVDMRVHAAYYELARCVKYKHLNLHPAHPLTDFKVVFEFDTAALYPNDHAFAAASDPTGMAAATATTAAPVVAEPTTPRGFFARLMGSKPAPAPATPTDAKTAGAAAAATSSTTASAPAPLPKRPPPLTVSMSDEGLPPGPAPLTPAQAAAVAAAAAAGGGARDGSGLAAFAIPNAVSPGSVIPASGGTGPHAAAESVAAANTIRTEPHGTLRGLLQSREFRAVVPPIIPLTDAIDQHTMKVFLVHVFNAGVTAAGGSVRFK